MNSTQQLLQLNNTLQKYNIGLSVFLFVACVEEQQLTLTDISEKINISTAGITTIRDSAERKGLVSEVESVDRRKKIYTITDKGIEMLACSRQ